MGHQRCSYENVLILKIKLGVYSSIIRPYLYSLLPENKVKSGHFIVDTLYFSNILL
jgi:hypothetical protein